MEHRVVQEPVNGPSTHYPQVYAASSFPSAGFITEIDFFQPPGTTGQLNLISFTISLSTTTLGLNVGGPGGLVSGDPDANVGADQTPFGTYTSPEVPSMFSAIRADPLIRRRLTTLRFCAGCAPAHGPV